MIDETPADEIVQPVIGIVGGSGLYDIDGLEDKA
jgi:purine nucleoside phosphorylase